MQCGRGAATQVMAPGEVEADLLAPLGRRRGHARGAHNGTDVDIDARCDGPQGSHIVICIHGSPRHLRNRTVEYVTDDSTLDSAVSTGFEIARAVIDGARVDTRNEGQTTRQIESCMDPARKLSAPLPTTSQ